MASTCSLHDDLSRIMVVAAGNNIGKMKKIREEIGDEGKFRRICDFGNIDLECHVLHVVVGLGALDMCKFLVDEVGVDIRVKNGRGDTPFLIAVKLEHVLIVEYLIERGVEITITDSNGYYALHLALMKENKGLLIMLLKYGADVEADSESGTPLHFAAIHGKAEYTKILLQNNAEPNSVSKYLGSSPLVSAICTDTNVECVELLLKAGADPNKSAYGLSPLAHAVQKKSKSYIDALLAAGADVDSVSSCGLRPIEYAAIAVNIEAIWTLILARPWLMATPTWILFNSFSKNLVEAKKMINLYSRNLQQNGDNAWDNQDYSSATASYTEAMHYNLKDEKLVANRGLCWARLGEGMFALSDAQTCVEMKPDWGKAHLREATAWHLLKRYRMSSNTFKRAFELDPENEEIER